MEITQLLLIVQVLTPNLPKVKDFIPQQTATISSFYPMSQFPTMVFPLLALRGEESP